jgi:ABC-type transport system substrate-binding protein
VVDFALSLPLQRIEKIKKSGKNDVILRDDTGQIALFYLGQKTQLKDLELRKAATLAIDVPAITKNVLLGKGGVASCSLLLPLLKAAERPGCGKRDLSAAKAITAKYSKPTIDFNYGPARGPSDEAVAQAIAAQLREAGFTVNMAPSDYNKLTSNLVLGKVDGLVMYAIVPVFPHPNVYAQGFLTPTSITKNCTAPGMAEYAQRGLNAGNLKSADGVYKEMERVALGEYYCMLPLYHVVNNWGMSKALRGFTPPPAVVIDWKTLYWE